MYSMFQHKSWPLVKRLLCMGGNANGVLHSQIPDVGKLSYTPNSLELVSSCCVYRIRFAGGELPGRRNHLT